jgi:hypothetical protein
MGLRDDILNGMAEAAAVVAEIGELVTMQIATAGSYDPVAGSTTPGETLTQQARAILDNYGLQSSGTQYSDGTQIMRDDKKLFLPAAQLDWPPTLETTVTASGKAWQVISVQTINPTGDVLAYELQVRR